MCTDLTTLQIGTVDIAARTHSPLRQFETGQGDARNVQRAYLEARRESNYAIRVRNRSDRRVGLVIAVDGRNVISGQKSHLRASERMYVLGPHQSAVYRGWRRRSDRVHSFYFTDVHESYADAWGDRTAMGVIAVAVYEEKHIHRPPLRDRPAQLARPRSRSRMDAEGTSEPGTGFGAERHAPSRVVSFESRHRPAMQYFIKYEWREELCRKGISRCQHRRNRFWPLDDDRYAWSRDFAPYPPGYRD